MEQNGKEKRISRAEMLHLMKQSGTAACVSPGLLWLWYYLYNTSGGGQSWEGNTGGWSWEQGGAQKGWTQAQTGGRAAKRMNTVTYPRTFGTYDYEKQWEYREKNRPDTAFAEAVNDFAVHTASALLAGEKGNANYSPLSLYYALTLAALGAKGETREQLLAMLGTDKAENLTEQAGRLFRTLYNKNRTHTLTLANSAWLADGGYYNDTYLRAAGELLYAELFAADFSNSGLPAALGQWVSEKTGGMLSAPLPVDRGTRALLLNTVHFADEWTDGFDSRNTVEGRFTTAAGGTVKARFMRRTVSGGFTRGSGWTRAVLPMKNSEMLFILPDVGVTVQKLLAQPERLSRLLCADGEESFGEISWTLPRFDFGVKYELIPMLKQLGLQDPFDASAADFSGMAQERLFIDSAIQQSRITVDEKGVAAAAYTELGMTRIALPWDRLEMKLDRPFLYAIVEQDTVLFVGVCADPSGK